MRRVVAGLIAVIALGAAAAVPGMAETKRATKQVGVYDDYFNPEEVKIHKGDRVKWVWDQFSVEDHNVTLKKGPGKKFHSPDKHYPTDPYVHRFKKRGRYKIWCTLHPQSMKMTVRVKR
jgi:plastocyanin